MVAGRAGVVYFIHAPLQGVIKIGYSESSPDRRFKAIQAASPVHLERLALIGGSYFLEQLLHVRFHPLRSHLEWFYTDDGLLSYIEEYAWPWNGCVGAFVKSTGIPARCYEDAIAEADPWFSEAIPRYAPRLFSEPMKDGQSVSRCVELLRNFRPTSNAANRAYEVACNAAAKAAHGSGISGHATILFRGGHFHDTSVKVPRGRLGSILIHGITRDQRSLRHIYEFGREPTLNDLQSDRLPLEYQGLVLNE